MDEQITSQRHSLLLHPFFRRLMETFREEAFKLSFANADSNGEQIATVARLFREISPVLDKGKRTSHEERYGFGRYNLSKSYSHLLDRETA